MSRNFRDLLEAQWARGNFVCVGLDSEFQKIPKSAHYRTLGTTPSVSRTIIAFNQAIVTATKDLVCAYKPNTAFYEMYGEEGVWALRQTIISIRNIAPDVPIILDAKRADIGNTNVGYTKMAFEYLGADAITVHPYLGGEALNPFLEYKDKGIFVLCRTSNPGAGEFQDLLVEHTLPNTSKKTMPLYQYVAWQVANRRVWNINGNCGLVVGATYPKELQEVRNTVGRLPILIPGIGAQGGDLQETIRAGKDRHGNGMIINSSRGIIFASSEDDFADVARKETEKLRDGINQYRGDGQ